MLENAPAPRSGSFQGVGFNQKKSDAGRRTVITKSTCNPITMMESCGGRKGKTDKVGVCARSPWSLGQFPSPRHVIGRGLRQK